MLSYHEQSSRCDRSHLLAQVQHSTLSLVVVRDGVMLLLAPGAGKWSPRLRSTHAGWTTTLWSGTQLYMLHTEHQK